MTVKKNNSGKSLFTLGGAIAVCVSVTVFFWYDSKSFAEHMIKALDEKQQVQRDSSLRRFDDIKETLKEIRSDIQYIRSKIK